MERLSKRFGETLAVDDLTLDIERGSFFALLGPSGCGKTTTLRMIGGFEEPTAGTVRLGGVDVTTHPPFRRDVNTVFQSYALFPHLTVERNVAFGLERKKKPRDEVRRRVGEALELVQLSGLESRKPGQLSGGQQQRVALARALVNEPRALLLDEPLGALDLRLRRQLQLELKRIQQEVGITFVHVTHDQEEALTMADTIAVMEEGRIEQLGPGDELYERPRTEFVANFLGVSNLLDGTVTGRDGATSVFTTTDGTALRVPTTVLDGIAGQARVGVRPEKMSIHPAAGAPDGLNAVRGQVALASFLGVSISYEVVTPAGHVLTVVAPNRHSGDARSHGPGEEVLLTWDPQHTFAVPRKEPG